MNRLPFLSPLVLASVLALSGCNSSSSGGGTGTLNVALTDTPACGFDHVYVTVDRVRVNASAVAGANAAGWHEVVLEVPQKIDLLALTNGVLTELGQTGLPAGHYQQVRLVLLPNTDGALNNSVVPAGGSEEALATPSAAQSGYKVVGDFKVAADRVVDLVLDFDACRSVVPKANGGYALKPVVTATVQTVSGGIAGHVDPADAGAVVYAEQDGRIVKGTVADDNGYFLLSPVLHSSSNGAYDIVLARAGDTTTIVRGVPVLANAVTTLSTAAQPFLLAPSPAHSVSGTVAPASTEAWVEALQASSGGNYVIAGTNAALDTGSYVLTLPTAAPLVGDFTGVLPVTLVADTTVAGRYAIRATTAQGATQSRTVDLQALDATGVDFLF